MTKTEHHPYGEFIPQGARAMLIGSFPIGKFTDPLRNAEIKSHEFLFFFGGEKNLLWRLIASARDKYISSKEDVMEMLEEMGLGVGDVILSCRRTSGGASDSDLYDITFNTELLTVIKDHKIKTIYFTSRKVETWFEKLFPGAKDLERISLISPSAQTLRAICRRPEFGEWKKNNPDLPALQFLYAFYKEVFSKVNYRG